MIKYFYVHIYIIEVLQVIEKDLIPILLNCKPENRIVFNSVVKLLVNLSLPAGTLKIYLKSRVIYFPL